MIKRKYRTDEEWLSLIHECRLSGLTDKQWCEAHQICPSNFYYQIQKFRKRVCEIPEFLIGSNHMLVVIATVLILVG